MSDQDDVKPLFEEMPGMLNTFALLARSHRARALFGIAAQEADALGELDDWTLAPIALAADDRLSLAFPQTYEDDVLCIVIGMDDDGAYVAHERGPACTLQLDGQILELAPGEERPLALSAPPERLLLRDGAGALWALERRPR